MPAEIVNSIFLNYGIIGLVVISFFVLVFWVVKTSKEREDKLYKIINTLSEELPEIRESLKNIELKIK